MVNEPNYSSNPSKDEPKKEKVRVIPLEYIDEFPGHPFKVLDDESMQKLMNSIEEIGVQSPIVARIKEDQRYEIISGHRRVHACRRLYRRGYFKTELFFLLKDKRINIVVLYQRRKAQLIPRVRTKLFGSLQ